MKKLAYLSVAAASAIALASPAAAQDVTGTVNITGTVTAKCLVVPANSNSFGATVDLGELAKADGTLESSATLETRFLSPTAGALSARVVCTSAAPTITVTATPITITSAPAPAAGYTGTVNYIAHAFVDTVSTNDVEFTDASGGGGSGPTAIGGRLANNGSDNINITATNFATTSPTDLLFAGGYSGQIQVVIAPGA
ncbi:hypothetical protein V6U71_21245 [Sphingopyxis sp. J-6]|uniref:hypothetical protein n=1 Tax=Sphingopyxis sp. J-6 TaxID=3122054 RepID=UPI003983FBF5